MSERTYASKPLAAVGAVIIRNGKFLFVLRKNQPKAGYWTLPGGLVESGESVTEAVIREVWEECQLLVYPVRLVDVLDFIQRDEDGRVAFHYVLIDFECTCDAGTAVATSDATEVQWVERTQIHSLKMPQLTRKFFEKHYGVS